MSTLSVQERDLSFGPLSRSFNIAVIDYHDYDDSDLNKAKKKSNIEAFAKSGTIPVLNHNRTPVFFDDGSDYGFFVVKSGVIYNPYHDSWISNALLNFDAKKSSPVGVIVPTSARTPKTANYVHIIAMNGDEGQNVLEGILSHQPTLSFECLSKFFKDGTSDTVAALLAKGTLQLVAWIPDTYLALSAAEKKIYDANNLLNSKERKPINPPQPGYTLVSGQWHRAATVLLRDTRKNGKSILIGQDESTYFGVELVDHPETIDGAYTSLMPKEIRGVSDLKRQGEWFIVPVAAKDAPTLKDAIAMSDEENGDSSLFLPLDDAESHHHYVRSDEIIITANGVYAKDGTLYHNGGEHVDVSFSGWVRFVKNTAIRSFSVQGVD